MVAAVHLNSFIYMLFFLQIILNNLTQIGATHYRVTPLHHLGAKKIHKVTHHVGNVRFAFDLSQFVLTHVTSVRSFSVTGDFSDIQ